MKKIKVKTDDLEIAVEYFLYASKEAGEANYRINQLGNELTADPDLLVCPEYQDIMENYASVKKSIQKISEVFEMMTSSVLKVPEMYSQAEYKNKERIEGLLKRTIYYQKAVAEENGLENIIKKAEDETDINTISDMVEKDHQSITASVLNADSVINEEKELTSDGNLTEHVNASFNDMEYASGKNEKSEKRDNQ